MKEIYPDKQKYLKIMFFFVCLICIAQFFLIAWMAGRMEFYDLHFYNQNKRILDIENRFQLEKSMDGE